MIERLEDKQLRSRCKNVERHLRLALSDWYRLLSRLSLSSESWLYDCEWWMKQVPSQLDVPWAFESLYDAIGQHGMLDVLVVKVDEVCLAMDREIGFEFPRSMYELRDSLRDLVKEVVL